MPGYPWTPIELIVLRGYYHDYDIGYFASFLPDRSHRAIRTKARRMGLDRAVDQRKYAVNDWYFSTPTCENCYWAGFIAADGYIDDTTKGQSGLGIKLHRKDVAHLKKLRDLLCPNKPLSPGIYPSLYVRSDKIALDLRDNFSIVPRKSLVLKPPNITDHRLVISYIAGYFDGDGNVQAGRSLRFLGTFAVLNWIKDHIGSQSKAEVRRRKNQFTYVTGKGRVWMFIECARELELPLLDRKWSQLTPPKQGYNGTYSKSVRSRQVIAWKMRQDGKTYQVIADKLGYSAAESARCAILSIEELAKRCGFDDSCDLIESLDQL